MADHVGGEGSVLEKSDAGCERYPDEKQTAVKCKRAPHGEFVERITAGAEPCELVQKRDGDEGCGECVRGRCCGRSCSVIHDSFTGGLAWAAAD